ncbi:hypothetical protein ACFQY0_08465 [Haloferula chungangensis]|uniref:Sel1 repeat family protein n=1 Tax=Haloferula chungangensis TaxID=1048331 RepID=A0ABW2L6A4_9BACT
MNPKLLYLTIILLIGAVVAQAILAHQKAKQTAKANAFLALGISYDTGEFYLGILDRAKDREEAMKWYRKAAEAGNPTAMNRVARELERSADMGKKRRYCDGTAKRCPWEIPMQC